MSTNQATQLQPLAPKSGLPGQGNSQAPTLGPRHARTNPSLEAPQPHCFAMSIIIIFLRRSS